MRLLIVEDQKKMSGFLKKGLSEKHSIQLNTVIKENQGLVPEGSSATESPIEWDTLVKRCMGNRKLANKALRIFGDGVAMEIAQIRSDLEDKNSQHLARVAHKLKGSAANISADKVTQIAGELERLAKAGAGAEQCEKVVEELNQELEAIKQYLSSMVAAAA